MCTRVQIVRLCLFVHDAQSCESVNRGHVLHVGQRSCVCVCSMARPPNSRTAFREPSVDMNITSTIWTVCANANR